MTDMMPPGFWIGVILGGIISSCICVITLFFEYILFFGAWLIFLVILNVILLFFFWEEFKKLEADEE